MTAACCRSGWLEGVLVVTISLVGLILRAWDLPAVSLDHFDEGVFAFSGLGLSDASQPYRLYPTQILFSPPLYPALIAAFYAIFGASGTAAVATNVCVGALTVPAVWAVGRTWFGAPTGVAAASLIALNEYHIRLSRTALTDPLFGLLLLLALAGIGWAVERRCIRTAGIAGLLTGLAWNTKYHGWLAPLIGSLALVGWTWHEASTWRHTLTQLLRGRTREIAILAIVSLVGVTLYVPWTAVIRSDPGGYAALLDYQVSMVNGTYPGQWFENARRQIEQQQFMEGSLSRASILASLAAVVAMTSQFRPLGRPFVLWVAAQALCSVVLGGAVTAALLAVLAAPSLARYERPYLGWLLLTWLAVWLVMAPMYRPYARLLLPFTLASALAAGFWLARLAGGMPQHSDDGSRAKQSRTYAVAAGAAAGAAVIVIVSLLLPGGGDPWRRTEGASSAAEDLARLIPVGSRVIVIGEPTVAYYLHISGRPAFERTERVRDIAAVEAESYVVTGVYAKRAPAIREGLDRIAGRLERLGESRLRPNDIRLLDDMQIRAARDYLRNPDDTFDLTVFRLRPVP